MHAVTSQKVRGALAAALVLVAVALFVAGLNDARQSLTSTGLGVTLFLALLPFAMWSYGLRSLRWHTLARAIVPGLSLLLSAYVQLIGFAFAVSPGRVAELYKLKLLERSTGVSVAQSMPALLVERLTEAMSLGLLVVVGEVLHLSTSTDVGSNRPLIVLGCGLLAVTVLGLLGRRLSWRSRWRQSETSLRQTWAGRKVLNVLTSGRISTVLRQLSLGGSRVARPKTLALALALVIVGRLGDGVVIWKISQAVGHPLPFPLAMVIVGTTGLVGGISLSPGGLGSADAALVGLLAANGMPLSLAIGAAFASRALLFWLWVVLGLGLFAVSNGYRLVKVSTPGERIGMWHQEMSSKPTVEREGQP